MTSFALLTSFLERLAEFIVLLERYLCTVCCGGVDIFFFRAFNLFIWFFSHDSDDELGNRSDLRNG